LRDSSVDVYQLHTSISHSRSGRRRDPLLICAQVL